MTPVEPSDAVAISLDVPPDLPPAIFDSAQAWAAYFDDAQARLAARRKAQENRAFWQAALQQAGDLLYEAQAAGDAEMAAELGTVVEGFRARLDGEFLHVPLSLSPEPVSDTFASPVLAPLVEAVAEEIVPQIAEAISAPDPEVLARQHAVAQEFIGEIAGWESAWSDLEVHGLNDANREWNRPSLFRLRSIACALGGLFARAHAENIAALVRPAAVDLRERMRLARNQIGERHDCVAFDEAYWVYAESGLLPDVWQELSQRYAAMAEAQTVWEWFLPNEDALGRQTRHDLLNALLAVQQSLCRRLEQLWGRRDHLQADLFYQIKNEAQDAGFLNAMSSETRLEALDEMGAELRVLWREAQTEADAFNEAQTRTVHKKNAVDAVVSLMKACGGETAPASADLLPLLDECLACGVPPTNAPVRNALLHHGPTLLANEPRFGKLLEAVLTERRRQKLDDTLPAAPTPKDKKIGGVEDDENSSGNGGDEETALAPGEHDQAAQTVGPWLRNKKVILLGGIPRQRTCDDLKRACGCADVQWPQSTDTDTAAKFKSDIQKSDVLLLLKNFARHDMSKRGRDWVTENGGHFVFITGGYGVRQIIHQLGEYASLNKLVEPAAVP